MLWPGASLLLLGCGLLAACGGSDAPAGMPPATLVLHGAAGSRALAAEDARRPVVLAELDSLLAAPGDALMLAVEPAALAAARAAGALELRLAGRAPWRLAAGDSLAAPRLLIPLTDAVPSLRAGEGTLLVFLGESEDVLVAVFAVSRGRERLRAALQVE
jgi:hypothetical protein